MEEKKELDEITFCPEDYPWRPLPEKERQERLEQHLAKLKRLVQENTDSD